MDLREEIAQLLAPDDFRLAEHWLHYAFRARADGWFALEYTGRYLVGVQRAYDQADAILQLITTRLTSEEAVESVARALCEDSGRDPEYLEPGNVIVHPLDDLEEWTDGNGVNIDELCDNGTRPPDGNNGKDPCHFMWREFIGSAQVAIQAAIGRATHD